MIFTRCSIETSSANLEVVYGLLTMCDIDHLEIEDEKEYKELLEDSSRWDYLEEEFANKDVKGAKITFYLDHDKSTKDKVESIRNHLDDFNKNHPDLCLGDLTLLSEDVDDSKWIYNWLKYYKPFNITENIVIKPTWENYDPKDNEIIFNIFPGHIFGTGLHQTTKMCVTYIEKYINKDDKVLDIGCGSGILFLISLLLGAKKATGVDVESAAARVVGENASLNKITPDKYQVFNRNLIESDSCLNSEKYEIILMNIAVDIITAMLPVIINHIKNDGYFICSGILLEYKDELIKTLEKNFTIIEITEIDSWVGIISQIKS